MLPSGRTVSWKTKASLAVFGTVLACAALEVGLRVASAWEARRARIEANAEGTPAGEYWAIYDPELGYRLNPAFGDTNALGLRDHPVGAKTEHFRLLFLGDSVAMYGDSVDDTLVGHLRSTLRADPALEGIEVINAAVRGYTNYQEIRYLKRDGIQLDPDLVVLQFCLNDLHKFLHSFKIEDGAIVPGTYQFSSATYERNWVHRVVDSSHLLMWLKSSVGVAVQAAALWASGGFSFDYMLDFSNAWRDEAWTDIETQLDEMAALAKRHGFDVFVTVVPHGSQYNSEYLERDRAYVLKPQRKLREICERLGVPFYDLYPDMGAHLFLDDRLHLTQEGRRLVGQRLAEVLAASGLLFASSPKTGTELPPGAQ